MLELNATMIAVILNFLLLAWLLNRFLYKPVQEALDGRRKAVTSNIEEAEKKNSDASALKAQYEDLLRGAQAKSQEILNNAVLASEKLREDAVASAREESQYIVSVAEKEAAKLKTDAMAAAKGDIASLVVSAAGMLLKKKIDDKSDRELVDGMIAGLDKVTFN